MKTLLYGKVLQCPRILICPDLAKKRERWFRVCCLWGAYGVPYSHVPKWRVGSLKRIIYCWQIRLGERELIWCLSHVCTTLWRLRTNWSVILDIHISGEHIHCIRLWQSGTGCLALALFIHSLWAVFRLRIDNRSNYEQLSKPLSTSVKTSTSWITMFNWGCHKVWHFRNSECFLVFVSWRFFTSFVGK
jgi:hypothetical protein